MQRNRLFGKRLHLYAKRAAQGHNTTAAYIVWLGLDAAHDGGVGSMSIPMRYTHVDPCHVASLLQNVRCAIATESGAATFAWRAIYLGAC